MKAGSIARDIRQILFIGLGLGLLLTIAGVAAALAIGIPGAGDRPINLAALIPTAAPPLPTNTPIPCTAPEWWAEAGPELATAMDSALRLAVADAVPEVQRLQAEFNVWQTRFEVQTDVAPCVEPVRAQFLGAAETAMRYFGLFTAPSTEAERAGTLVTLYDQLLRGLDGLEQLEVATPGEWADGVRAFSGGDCPAQRWYLEIFVARDYNRFFSTFNAINFQVLDVAAVQESLRTMRSLRSSFATDNGVVGEGTPPPPNAAPACAGQAVDHLLAAMDGYLGFTNAYLNNSLASAQPQLDTANSERAAFYLELGRLDPALANVRPGT